LGGKSTDIILDGSSSKNADTNEFDPSKFEKTGTVFLNGNNCDPNAPFGDDKQSGNGREWGDFAFEDFLDIKGIVGD